MNSLPIVTWNDENNLFFFDERLKELRNVNDFSDTIPLNDFEIEHYKQLKVKKDA